MASNGGNSSETTDIRLPDIKVLRLLARELLVHLLESIQVPKDLVIDPELMRPLDRIAGSQLLKAHGVNKIYKLEPKNMDTSSQGRMYLVRPTIQNAKLIADQMNADKKHSKSKIYKILYSPKRMFACDMIMEEEGVYEEGIYEEFRLDLIPLDDDILSLEILDFFKSFFLDGDQTWIQTIASSIVNLQNLFGTIPNVYGMGKCSKNVYDMVKNLQTLEGSKQSTVKSEIGHMFLIDRDEDMVTPLCTQTTYEGLVDERYGIQCGFCELPEIVMGKEVLKKVLLTNEDILFEAIRSRHISNVFGFFKEKAQEVKGGFSKGRNVNTVTEMKDFVSNELKDLKQQYKSVTIHMGACEGIMAQTSKQHDFQEQLQTEHSMLEGNNLKDCYTYIEEQIIRQIIGKKGSSVGQKPPIPKTAVLQYCNMAVQGTSVASLRLCCLLSLTQNGLPTREFRALQTYYLHSYGHEHLLTFNNLKRLGMFTEQTTVEVSKMSALDVKTKIAEKALKRTAFRLLCKRLNLIPKMGDVNLRSPNDMSFVFSGAYTPLSCKIIEHVLIKQGWSGLDEIRKLLNGPCFQEHHAVSAKGSVHSRAGANVPSDRVILVYFLGGCTFAEMAALRLLGKLKGYKFLFATTAIITGQRLLESVRRR